MFPTLVNVQRLQSALDNDLLLFLPELVVCVGIVMLLLARLVPLFDRATSAGSRSRRSSSRCSRPRIRFTIGQWAGVYFAGMLISDAWGGFVRVVVLAAALLTVLLTLLTGIPDREDSADFYMLLLGGTLGMMLMASREPPADGVHRRRDGEPAELRPGRLPQGEGDRAARRR